MDALRQKEIAAALDAVTQERAVQERDFFTAHYNTDKAQKELVEYLQRRMNEWLKESHDQRHCASLPFMRKEEKYFPRYGLLDVSKVELRFERFLKSVVFRSPCWELSKTVGKAQGDRLRHFVLTLNLVNEKNEPFSLNPDDFPFNLSLELSWYDSQMTPNARKQQSFPIDSPRQSFLVSLSNCEKDETEAETEKENETTEKETKETRERVLYAQPRLRVQATGAASTITHLNTKGLLFPPFHRFCRPLAHVRLQFNASEFSLVNYRHWIGFLPTAVHGTSGSQFYTWQQPYLCGDLFSQMYKRHGSGYGWVQTLDFPSETKTKTKMKTKTKTKMKTKTKLDVDPLWVFTRWDKEKAITLPWNFLPSTVFDTEKTIDTRRKFAALLNALSSFSGCETNISSTTDQQGLYSFITSFSVEHLVYYSEESGRREFVLPFSGEEEEDQDLECERFVTHGGYWLWKSSCPSLLYYFCFQDQLVKETKRNTTRKRKLDDHTSSYPEWTKVYTLPSLDQKEYPNYKVAHVYADMAAFYVWHRSIEDRSYCVQVFYLPTDTIQHFPSGSVTFKIKTQIQNERPGRIYALPLRTKNFYNGFVQLCSNRLELYSSSGKRLVDKHTGEPAFQFSQPHGQLYDKNLKLILTTEIDSGDPKLILLNMSWNTGGVWSISSLQHNMVEASK